MKDETEIQRAHDLLHAIVVGDIPGVAFTGENLASLHAAHDTLAWALGFPCGHVFEQNVDKLRQWIRQAGFEETDAGEPMSHEEARKRGFIR
jgi:hypothetical protein